MATPAASDMAQFFDFCEAAMPDVMQDVSQYTTQSDDTQPIPPNQETAADTNTEFNTDFSSWLPRYQKPVDPCDYCRTKGLECFIYDADGSGQTRCSPCNALFRPCSFVNFDKTPLARKKTAIDTLDIVGEDEERCFGQLTGRKQLRSVVGHIEPIEDEHEDDQTPKKGAAVARFPRAAVKILKDWMIQHIDHPYPTEEEKDTLKQQTSLTIGQISNWMANTRRRQKARPKRSASPSIRPSTEAIDIPAGRTWESLNPFERWKHSPPENEPAPMTAIAQAMETFDLPHLPSLSSSYQKGTSIDSTGSFSMFRAPSISSLETGLTGMSSGSLGSHNSAYSHGSRHSLGSMNSLKSKERRRRRRLPTRAPKADLEGGVRLFQCTFCTDRFKNKYDWSRHEKSLHLSLEKWICAPLGEVILDKTTGNRKCVYCDILDPSDEHLATHGHNACIEKGLEARTFYRKDHLRQHLRLMHGCKMTASMDTWKSEAQFIKSRCGFCDAKFDEWQDRIDHLAKEFRNGAEMKKWKGCRGLEAHVAVHVTNAMPPYLIANESKSPFPFSASNSSSLQQTNMQLESSDLDYLLPTNLDLGPSSDLSVAYEDPSSAIGPIILTTPASYTASEHPHVNANATCWEILTLRLGRYAREYIAKYGATSLTDKMLQDHAHMIIYGSADGWEQTAADNPEWLSLFKKAHGITSKTHEPRMSNHQDVFEDLGIHANTVLDPSFDIRQFDIDELAEGNLNDNLNFDTALAGGGAEAQHTRGMSSERQSPHSLTGLTSSISASSASQFSQAPATSSNLLSGTFAPILELACTSPDGPCYGEEGKLGLSKQESGSSKERYWLNDSTEHMASFVSQCAAAGEPVHECVKAGLRSFDLLDPVTCPMNDADGFMPAVQEQQCTKTGEAVNDIGDFVFPSFDELPEEFQNPMTSADYVSSIPISTTAGMSMPGLDGATASPLAWDNDEMNFAMDMDMDLDLSMNIFGKC